MCHFRSHAPQQTASLFNNLGGVREQCRRQGEAERFCCLQVDQELELGGLINRDVAGFGPFQDLVAVAAFEFRIGEAPSMILDEGM
jgi:hypothetical protein